jgi:hypothetical protein
LPPLPAVLEPTPDPYFIPWPDEFPEIDFLFLGYSEPPKLLLEDFGESYVITLLFSVEVVLYESKFLGD